MTILNNDNIFLVVLVNIMSFCLDRENFYQIFVHGIKDDRPLVLMLKKDNPGQALRDIVQEKCPKLPSSFILLHQGRKVLVIVFRVDFSEAFYPFSFTK